MQLISLANLWSLFSSVALSVVFFKAYAFQREVGIGENRHDAMHVGVDQGIMGALLMSAIAMSFPAVQSVYGFYWLSTLVSGLPIFAALVAGGYAHMSQRLEKYDIPLLKTVVQNANQILALVPESFGQPVINGMTLLHKHIGNVYFAAQMAVFTSSLVMRPILGFVGMAYTGISYLRAKNYLPFALSSKIEKFNYWTNLFSGVFLENRLVRSLAALQIGNQIAINVIAPKFVKNLLGENSQFLQVTGALKAKTHPKRIDRDISYEKFVAIINLLPPLRKSEKEVSVERANAIKDDLYVLVDEFNSEVQRLSVLEEYREIQENSEFPQTGVILQLNHAKNIVMDYIRLNYKLMKEVVPLAADFFERKRSQKDYETTISHMARVPEFLPPAPQIDLDQFVLTVQPRFIVLGENFRATCLESPKFHAIDENLKARIVDLEYRKEQAIEKRKLVQKRSALITHVSAHHIPGALGPQQLDALERYNNQCKAEIDGINEYITSINGQITHIHVKLIAAWRIELKLDVATPEREVLAAYIEKRLRKLCHQVRTGEDILWNKTAGSIGQFRDMSMHLFAHCLERLEKNDVDSLGELDQILTLLAIDAGDYCATGVYDVVESLYGIFVLNKLYKTHQNLLTPGDKLAIYLQEQRQDLFEQIYNALTQHPLIVALFPSTDFASRHTRSSVLKALSILHLKSRFNAQSDLSNQQQGFITETMMHFFAYFIARAIMLVESGYSPENIVADMSKRFGESSELAFNVGECCTAWANSFSDPKIKEFILDVLIAYDDDSEAARQQLYTALLYDYGVFDCLNESVQLEIARLSPMSPTNELEPSKTLYYTKKAGTLLFLASRSVVQGAYDAANYVTRAPTQEEMVRARAMRPHVGPFL